MTRRGLFGKFDIARGFLEQFAAFAKRSGPQIPSFFFVFSEARKPYVYVHL
jgi:hypothetical protein